VLRSTRILKPVWHNRSSGVGIPLTSGGGGGFLLAKGALVLCEGDSISSQVDGRSLAGWLSFVSNGRLNFIPSLAGTPGTIGTGGEGTTQILAQAPAAVAAYPNLAALILHIGTNSLNSLTAAQMISEISQTIEIYNAANIHVIFSCILPKTADAPTEQKRKDVNAGIAALTGKKLTVVNHDLTHPMSDASWQGSDALPHPNVVGTRRMAQNIFNSISVATISVYDELTTNLIVNSTFLGTSGLIASGFPGGSTCPDGWRLQNDTGATMSQPIIVTEGGVRKMQIDASGTCSSASFPFLFSRNNDTTLAVLAGEWLDGKFDVEITGAGGVGDPVGLDGWEVSAGDSIIFDDANGPATFGHMSQNTIGVARVLPLKSAADQASRTFAFKSQFAVGAVSARFKLSLPVAVERAA
jgi:lysophospholipase L1-like esterase